MHLRRRHQRTQRRAFTLIELLVVIAIISILAGLLLPSLSKAKSQAAKVVDLDNLKQVMVAVHLYAEDSADALPWPNWASGDVDTNGVSRQGWLYTFDQTTSGPNRFRAQTGLFWKTLATEKLYVCPNDTLSTSRRQQCSSYAMNGAVVGFNRAAQPVKFAEMNSSDCAFWETDETQPTYFNDGANYPTEGVSRRHLQGAIQAAFDGSVNYIKLQNWYQDVMDTNRNRLWCYPGSPDGR